MNQVEPGPGVMDLILTLLPRNIAQTTLFDDALEYLPTRKNYYSTERHTKIPE